MHQETLELNCSRTSLALDSTLVVVVEMSLSTWVVCAEVPRLERRAVKKLSVYEPEILSQLHRWRDEAEKGHDCRALASALPTKPVATPVRTTLRQIAVSSAVRLWPRVSCSGVSCDGLIGELHEYLAPTLKPGKIFLIHLHSNHVSGVGEEVHNTWLNARTSAIETIGSPCTADLIRGARNLLQS